MPFDTQAENDLSTSPLRPIERRKTRGLIQRDDLRRWRDERRRLLLRQAVVWAKNGLGIPSFLVALWKLAELLHWI